MKTLLTFFICSISFFASALDLSDTVFERAANHYNIDPLLLYSVALAESASGRENGGISPWNWTLRSKDGSSYSMTKQEASEILIDFIAKNGEKASIDVGMMQINLRWHSHRVNNALDLLDTEKNVFTGASILSETLKSTDDLIVGIGRYNSWTDEKRLRKYGSKVLSIYNQLLQLQGSRSFANAN